MLTQVTSAPSDGSRAHGCGEWARGRSDTRVPEQLRQHVWRLNGSDPKIRINDAEGNLWRHTLPAARGVELGVLPPFLPRVSFYLPEQPGEIMETREYNKYTIMLCNSVT